MFVGLRPIGFIYSLILDIYSAFLDQTLAESLWLHFSEVVVFLHGGRAELDRPMYVFPEGLEMKR